MKKKFIMLLVVGLALMGMTVPIHATVWDTTRVYTGTVTLGDVAIGNKLKDASDDTVRVFTVGDGSPYNVLLFTDTSSAPPMKWRTEVVKVETKAMRGVAIGDPNRDGKNDLVYGYSGSSPYLLKRAYWTGSAWTTEQLASFASGSGGYISDIAIGDADNDGIADDIILCTLNYVFRVRWNGASWDTTRIFNGTSTTGTVTGVAIGDFDTTYPGNEIVAVTYVKRVYRIRWTGSAWDATLIYLAPAALQFFDVAVGDFDADNPGAEIAINNSVSTATYGAVFELYGSGDNWTARPLFTPAGWGTWGEIAVGDFLSYHPGVEIVATRSSTDAMLVYGSGSSWISERIVTLGTNTKGVDVGNVNRYHNKSPLYELAVASNKAVFEVEEKLLNNNMATLSIDNPAAGVSFEGNTSVPVKATVKNDAPNPQNTVPVCLQITDGGSYTYSDTEYSGTLNQNQTQQITFAPNWIVPSKHAVYTIKVWTALPTDEYWRDDTLSISVFSYPQGYSIESFENPTFPPEDWTERHTTGNGWVWTTNYPHTGSHSAMCIASSGSHWLITPQLDVSGVGDQLQYWIQTYYYTYTTDWVFVEISTGTSDTSDFVAVDSCHTNAIPGSYIKKTVDLSGYSSDKAAGKGLIYVAFHYQTVGCELHLDDILMPPKYVPPQDIALLSIDGLSNFVENGTNVMVKATVQNQAVDTLPAGVPIKLRIDGPAGYVYADSDQTTLTNIPPGGTEQITFSPDWLVPDILDYFTVTVWSELLGDAFPTNDTVSQQVLVYRAGGLLETFTKTSFPPTSWTVYNFDGGDVWRRNTSYYHSPPACAYIYYDTPNNDWLITPRLRVQNGDNLRYWWKAQSSAYVESLYVRVSTNPNVADTGSYTAVDMVSGNSGIFTERLIDLSSYAGQMIYVAFHYPVNHQLAVCVDDVTGPYFPTTISLNPASFDVEAFPDTNVDRILNVGNVGGGVLNYNITLAQSSSWLSFGPDSGSAATGEEDPITLTFHTTGMDGHYYDTLVIVSNSGEKENADTALVPIHLWVRLIPQISVSPDSFAVELEGNSTRDSLMFIGNPGYGILDYNIWTEEWTTTGALYSGEPANREHGQYFKSLLPPQEEDKNLPEYRFGESPETGHGGPDLFGYRWIDSDESGGPVFNWIEINEIGTLVDVTNDGNVGLFDIGFPFKFYGNEFTQFRVASDGFVSFTSTTGTPANVPIPSTAEPNNLLALFWDDLNSASGTGRGYIYYHSDGNRLVVEWDHVKRSNCDTCLYTMEMILYPNDKIIYQYKDMTGHRLNEGTVGIENGDGTIGLEVVYNAFYVRDSLAIAFWPAPAWLSYSPDSGTVPVDGIDTIDVGFNSIGILGGEFTGAFVIVNNDPYKPIDTIPTRFTILSPHMTFSPDSALLSGTEGGTPFDFTLNIGNTGAGKLIYHIVESVPWLSVSPLADTVDVGGPASEETLTIDCTSLYAGTYLGQLKVYSNDPDLQPYTIYQVHLHVGPDPDISVSPDSLHVPLFPELSMDTTLTISNDGDGHLVWDMTIEDLKATENRETILTEGFEGSFPPSGWSVSGSCTPGSSKPCLWYQDCSGLYVHSGSCSAVSGWGYSLDVWLKTPLLTLGVGPYLKFWWYSSWYWHVYPYNNGDLFVKISTDGGTSWNTLWTFGDSAMVVNSGGPWPWVNWTWYEATIELPEIFGDAIIAFHIVANDNADISIDDVEVGRMGPPWLSISSHSGVINPHSSADVTVTLSSVGVTQDRFANLHLTSNDPEEGSIQIPVHLEILEPNYSISPAETLVIDALENQYTEGYLYVQNFGGRATLSYKMTDPVSWLSEIPDTSDVPIDGEDTVIVKVDGYQLIAGNYATKLFIKTNDFDTPNDTLVVIVHVGPPPDIRVVPDSFTVVAPAGGTKDTTMTVYNDGDGHLAFELTIKETGPKFSEGAGLTESDIYKILKANEAYRNAVPANLMIAFGKQSQPGIRMTADEIMAKRQAPKQTSGAGLLKNGPIKACVVDSWGNEIYDCWDYLNANWSSFGPDEIIIDYSTLDFDYIDYPSLVASGADVLIISNAWRISSSLGIDWHFTDAETTAIHQYLRDGHGLIMTSGTFNSGPYTEISDNGPRLAPMVGLDPATYYNWPDAGYLYSMNLLDPSHPVLDGVPDPYYPGDTDYLTCTPQSEDWHTAIVDGEIIALSSDNIGAIIVYSEGISNRVYISSLSEYESNTADHQLFYNSIIWGGGVVSWLSLAPVADTVDPHSSTNVTLHFDATELLSGEKFGNIIISSNDPDESPWTVPVHMIVAGAQYAITPESLHIEALENQYTNAHLTISNPGGQGPLSYKMTDPVAWLTENPDTAQILPDGEQDVTVRVDGHLLIAGNYATEILVKTNAVNQQYDTIPVTVHVGPDAEVDIAPMSLNVPVIPGCNKVEKVKVSNLGLGHLRFETSIKWTGPKFSAGLNPNKGYEVQKRNAEDRSKSAALLSVTGTENARLVDKSNPAHLTVLGPGGASMVSPPGSPVMPEGDTVFIQLPHDPSEYWSFATSDLGAGYKVYENFWGVNLPISGIQWWGFCLKYISGWVAGDPNNLVFDITFYSDPPNDPVLPPADVVCTYTNVVPPTIVPTQLYYTYQGYFFGGVELNPLCDLSEGWVSIQSKSAGTGYDWFLWASAKTGDGFSYQEGASTPGTLYDRALILTGTPYPFTVSPEADTLDPHTSIDLLVTFDGSAFEPCGLDTLRCNLLFHSNDPDEALVTVPVTMWSGRGDVNGDCRLDVVDVVFLLNYIFIGGPAPNPLCVGDVDRSGGDPDSEDALYLISYLFLCGPPPEMPLAPGR
jgi:hypothetical protein